MGKILAYSQVIPTAVRNENSFRVRGTKIKGCFKERRCIPQKHELESQVDQLWN